MYIHVNIHVDILVCAQVHVCMYCTVHENVHTGVHILLNVLGRVSFCILRPLPCVLNMYMHTVHLQAHTLWWYNTHYMYIHVHQRCNIQVHVTHAHVQCVNIEVQAYMYCTCTWMLGLIKMYSFIHVSMHTLQSPKKSTSFVRPVPSVQSLL